MHTIRNIAVHRIAPKPAPLPSSMVTVAKPNCPHPALGNMKDTKRLAKLMSHCCGTIEEIMREPPQDQEAARRLTELETQILTYWPWIGYSKLLCMRHEINAIVVS